MIISDFNRVYVVSPAYSKTGGLELLHQLVFSLNTHGIDAEIAYASVKDGDPINPEYRQYVSSYVRYEEIEDIADTLIIISEHQVHLMQKFTNASVAIWWLSVDNYLKVYTPTTAYRLLGFKGLAWYIKNCRWKFRVSKIRNRIQYNFAQSHYALDFLKKNKFHNIYYLSDYLNDRYLTTAFDVKTKKDYVLYNPKKGMKYTRYLMNLDKTLTWIPIENLSREEVRNLLLQSKVYVDFGNHPGKDRFPREAAICGCCVITGKRGSANYFADVPIPSEYKFEDSKRNSLLILKTIHRCINEYDTCISDFDRYRTIILDEKKHFNQDIKNIFGE